jgi:hypothetical protein
MSRDTVIVVVGAGAVILGLAGIVAEMYGMVPGVLAGTTLLFLVLIIAGMTMLGFELWSSWPEDDASKQHREGACECKHPVWGFWVTHYNAQRYCIMRCQTCEGFGYYVTTTCINYERIIFPELPEELREHIRERSAASTHEGTAGPSVH